MSDRRHVHSIEQLQLIEENCFRNSRKSVRLSL